MSDASQASSSASQSVEAVQSDSQEQSNMQAQESQEVSSDISAEGHTSEAAIDADPSLSKAEKAEAKKTLKKLRIKYNGREMDEELPFEIPDDPKAVDYMKKQLQMSKMAQTKAQEYAQLQKEAVEFIEQLRKNPRKILSDPNLGVDLKKIAAEMLEEEIENSRKSPEQLEKEKLEKELQSLKEEREREKEEMKKKEFERIQQEAYEKYDMQMSRALESSDLPKTPYVVKKMADYMLLGLQNDMDITPEDVLPLVREEMHQDLKDMFAVMPEDVIEQIVGKETINKIRKKQIAKAKQAQVIQKPKIEDAGQVKKEEGKEQKKVNMKDFFGF